MPVHEKTIMTQKQDSTQSSNKMKNNIPDFAYSNANYKAIIKRIRMYPQSMTNADTAVLERTIGHRAVYQLIKEIGLTKDNTGLVKLKAMQKGEKVLQRKPDTIYREAAAQEEKKEPVQSRADKINQKIEIPERKEYSKIKNKTDLPDNLKAGMENLSGMSMDGVRVHYNSVKPAKVNALAFTQGTDIHIASGQEKHLPHEAWHVVQQAQGRVQPSMQIQGVQINDDIGLETEADYMARKACIQPLKNKRTEYSSEKREDIIQNNISDADNGKRIIRQPMNPSNVIQKKVYIDNLNSSKIKSIASSGLNTKKKLAEMLGVKKIGTEDDRHYYLYSDTDPRLNIVAREVVNYIKTNYLLRMDENELLNAIIADLAAKATEKKDYALNDVIEAKVQELIKQGRVRQKEYPKIGKAGGGRFSEFIASVYDQAHATPHAVVHPSRERFVENFMKNGQQVNSAVFLDRTPIGIFHNKKRSSVVPALREEGYRLPNPGGSAEHGVHSHAEDESIYEMLLGSLKEIVSKKVESGDRTTITFMLSDFTCNKNQITSAEQRRIRSCAENIVKFARHMRTKKSEVQVQVIYARPYNLNFYKSPGDSRYELAKLAEEALRMFFDNGIRARAISNFFSPEKTDSKVLANPSQYGITEPGTPKAFDASDTPFPSLSRAEGSEAATSHKGSETAASAATEAFDALTTPFPGLGRAEGSEAATSHKGSETAASAATEAFDALTTPFPGLGRAEGSEAATSHKGSETATSAATEAFDALTTPFSGLGRAEGSEAATSLKGSETAASTAAGIALSSDTTALGIMEGEARKRARVHRRRNSTEETATTETFSTSDTSASGKMAEESIKASQGPSKRRAIISRDVRNQDTAEKSGIFLRNVNALPSETALKWAAEHGGELMYGSDDGNNCLIYAIANVLRVEIESDTANRIRRALVRANYVGVDYNGFLPGYGKVVEIIMQHLLSNQLELGNPLPSVTVHIDTIVNGVRSVVVGNGADVFIYHDGVHFWWLKK